MDSDEISVFMFSNYEEKMAGDVERGQRVSSYDKMAKERLSVKLAIDKKDKQVAIKSTNRYSVFTVINYNKYQDDGRQKGKQRADKREREGKQRATTKEYKIKKK